MQLYPVPQNLILRAATRARLPHLARKLKHVAFDAGQSLWPSDSTDLHALFPLRGVLSLQVATSPAKQVEIGLVGPEGFAGIPFFLGSEAPGMEAVALTSGEAVVMTPQVFRGFLVSPVFRTAVERYAQLFLSTISRTSVCNRVHVIE